MSKIERVRVAVANESPQQLDIDVVSKWEPKNITRVSGHVFFSIDGKYMSMKITDYNKIFK